VSSILGVISGITFYASKNADSIELIFIGRIFGGLSAGNVVYGVSDYCYWLIVKV